MFKLKGFKIKCLLLLLIFLLGINDAAKLHASEVEYKRYDRQEMGVFYKEAEKYKEEIKWEEVVNRGREIVKSQWEMRMWEELAREFRAEDITEEEIDEIIRENEVEWEAEANADMLLEKGRWKAIQYREEIQEEITNDEEIAEFRRWCEQVEEDIEGMDLRAGLEEWAEHLRNITTSKNEKREAVRALIEEKIEQELSKITDNDEREKYEKGFREEIEKIAKEFEKRWEWEADATWIRKRNIWMMDRTRDESMRQEYENRRASVIAERIIGETKERADKSIEDSLAEEAEKEDWEQKKEYRHYEKVIGEGLSEWNKALSAFYRNWDIWRKDAEEQFEEGQREWERGYELIKNEREAWLLRTEERIRQGLREWQDKWEEVEREREEAEQELTRYIQIQKNSWNDHIAGIENVLISGSGILKQAEDNLKWIEKKREQYRAEGIVLEAEFQAKELEYEKWVNIQENEITMEMEEGKIGDKQTGIIHSLEMVIAKSTDPELTPEKRQYWQDVLNNGIQPEETYISYEGKFYSILDLEECVRISYEDMEQAREKFEEHNYSFYSREYEKWEEIRDEINEYSRENEGIYHDEDIWGDTLGLFHNNLENNPSDLYYMTLEEKELEKLKAEREYWVRRLEIAEAIKEYSQANGTIREKKEESENKLRDTQVELNRAKSNYKVLLDDLNNVVKSTMENRQEILHEKSEAISSAKKKLNTLSEDYEKMRLMYIVLENPELTEKIQDDLNLAYKRIQELNGEIKTKEGLYLADLNEYIKVQLKNELITEIEECITQAEKFREDHRNFTEIIQTNKDKECWIQKIGAVLLDSADSFWDKEEKKTELQTLLDDADDTIGEDALLRWIVTEYEALSLSNQAAVNQYEFITGGKSRIDIEAEQELLKNEYQGKIIEFNKELALKLEEVFKGINIDEIEDTDEFINKIMVQIEDDIRAGISGASKKQYEIASAVISYIKNIADEINALFKPGTSKITNFINLKQGIIDNRIVSEKIDNKYKEITANEDERDEILYGMLETGDEKDVTAVDYLIGKQKEIIYESYITVKKHLTEKLSSCENILKYVNEKDLQFGEGAIQRAELYNEIVVTLGIDESSTLYDEDKEYIKEKAEGILTIINELIEKGINSSIIENIKRKVEGTLYSFKLAEFIADNKDKFTVDIEKEIEDIKNQIEEREKDIEFISTVLSDIYDEEGPGVNDIMQAIMTNDYFQRAGNEVNNEIEGITNNLKEKKVYESVMDYISLEELKTPEEYVDSLTGIDQEQKNKIKHNINVWYVIKDYEHNRSTLIQTNNITDWIDSMGVIDEETKEILKGEIIYEEYSILKLNMENVITGMDSLNNYSGDIREYGKVVLFRDYLKDKTFSEDEEIRREELRAEATNYINTRDDMELNEENVLLFIDTSEENILAVQYLSKQARIRLWKERYNDYGMEKDEFIADYLEAGETDGDVIAEVTSYIGDSEAMEHYELWSDPDWYADEYNISADKLELYTLDNMAASPGYNEVLYKFLEIAVINKDIEKQKQKLGESLRNEIYTIREAIEGKAEILSLNKGLKEYKEIAHDGKNWRQHLARVNKDPQPEIIKTDEIRTDREGIYYVDVDGNYERDEARDRLNELKDVVIESIGIIKQEQGAAQGRDEIIAEIGDYYNINTGRAELSFDEYKNVIMGELSAIEIGIGKTQGEYGAKKSEVYQRREEIRRNSEILEVSGESLQEFVNEELKPAAAEVTESKAEYEDAKIEMQQAEQMFKESQDAYVDKLNDLKGSSEDMDDARLEYEKALGIYEWAVSEYIYSQSSEASETDDSGDVEEKRDAVDEYNRIKAIYDDYNERCQDKQEEVDNIVRHDDLPDDEGLKEMVDGYKEEMEAYIRIGKAEVNLERLIKQSYEEAKEAKTKYDKMRDSFFRQGGDVKRRDSLLNAMIDSGTYTSGKVQWMGANLGSLSGDDLYVYGNVPLIAAAARQWSYKINNEGIEAYHRNEKNKLYAKANEYAKKGAALYAAAGFWNPYGYIAAAIMFGYAAKYNSEAADKAALERQFRNKKNGNINSFNAYMNAKNIRINNLKNARTDLINKQEKYRKYACARDVDEVKQLIKSTYKFIEEDDVNYLVEVEEGEQKENEFNINVDKLICEIKIEAIDSTKEEIVHTGYNLFDVTSALRGWLRIRTDGKWKKVKQYAESKEYKTEEVNKLHEEKLRGLQEYAVNDFKNGREGASYVSISSELLNIGREAYDKAIEDEEEIQKYKWDLKMRGFEDEKKKWGDTMVLVEERGRKQWSQMQVKYVNMWRSWYFETKRAIAEKEEDFIEAEEGMKQDRDIWMRDVIEKGVNYRKEEVIKVINNSVKKSEKIADKSGNIIKAIDGEKISRQIVDAMKPAEVSSEFIHAARSMDISFSIDKIREIGYNNRSTGMFEARLEHYTKEMENMGKIQMAEQMNRQIQEIEEGYEQALQDQDTEIRVGMEETFISKGFSIGDYYSRPAIEDSTLLGGDDYEMQEIEPYRIWSGYDITVGYINLEEAKGMGMYEIELYTEVAMNNVTKEYNRKQGQLNRYVGIAPEFNKDGDISVSGRGETGRLITSLVDAEKEKAEGEAKADQPWYKKGVLPGININITTIAKIGMSFLPGGQLIALALSVAETAYDLATGVISWAQAGLNTLTSAVGAGVSWLGDVAGNAVKTVIGGVGNAAKTIGNVASSVAKNVVNTVGNVFNKGFYVNKDGGMDWHMNTSKWEHGFNAETLNFTSSLAGDITSDIIGYDTDPRTGKNIPKTFGFAGKDISINGLAKNFASESVRAYNTGEFNVNIINAGIFMDAGDQMSWGTGFWGRMGHSMYLQDSDIAAARSFGLGVSFSKNGAKWKNSVSGGFDISDISHAAISRGADWAGEATGTKDFFNGIYDAAGSVSEAMYHGINNSLNFVHDKAVSGIKAVGNLAWSGVKAVGTGAYSLVQSEQGNPEQNKLPQTPYEKHSTNPRDAITEEERKKRKGFSQKEKDELKDYYKKAYNLDDEKAQTLINALERGYIAQSTDKQYAEAGVSDIELHKKSIIDNGKAMSKSSTQLYKDNLGLDSSHPEASLEAQKWYNSAPVQWIMGFTSTAKSLLDPILDQQSFQANLTKAGNHLYNVAKKDGIGEAVNETLAMAISPFAHGLKMRTKGQFEAHLNGILVTPYEHGQGTFVVGSTLSGLIYQASINSPSLKIKNTVKNFKNLIKDGKISVNNLKEMMPKNLKNEFIPSKTILKGFKYNYEINGKGIQVKWHSPDLNAAQRFPGCNSGSGWTAQIKIGKRLLGLNGKFYKDADNFTHIPIKF